MMRGSKTLLFAAALVCALVAPAWADKVTFKDPNIVTVEGKPLADAVGITKWTAPKYGKVLKVGALYWGAEIIPVIAQEEGIFARELTAKTGYSVQLVKEDRMTEQLKWVANGETPIVRCEVGQCTMIQEAAQRAGRSGYFLVQLSYSDGIGDEKGGDVFVALQSVKGLNDLANGTYGMQIWGPHNLYFGVQLLMNRIDLSTIRYAWFSEITVPTANTGGKLVDPKSAWLADTDNVMKGVMVILPDALTLTSDGTVGTGGESKRGAHIVATSKALNKAIADGYWIDAQFTDQHPEVVNTFVRSLMMASENYQDIMAKKDTNRARYDTMLRATVKMLTGVTEKDDVAREVGLFEPMLMGFQPTGYYDNVLFAKGQSADGRSTTRTIRTLNDEARRVFPSMGLLPKTLGPNQAVLASFPGLNWDAIGQGLKTTASAKSTRPGPGVDLEQWAAKNIIAEAEPPKGLLFTMTINFANDQTTFPAEQYAGQFQEWMEALQIAEGASNFAVGYADPYLVKKMESEGAPSGLISQTRQAAKGKTKLRAKSAITAFFEYCRSKGYEPTVENFDAQGVGVERAVVPDPKTARDSAKNRRVVIEVREIETEAEAPGN